MAFNGLLNLFLLNPDVSLCDCCAAVLQELLNQSDVVAAVLIDFRGVIFAETVSADTGDTQLVANELELLLYCPLSQREDYSIRGDPVVQTVASDELV